jgi:hypothetical protein
VTYQVRLYEEGDEDAYGWQPVSAMGPEYAAENYAEFNNSGMDYIFHDDSQKVQVKAPDGQMFLYSVQAFPSVTFSVREVKV